MIVQHTYTTHAPTTAAHSGYVAYMCLGTQSLLSHPLSLSLSHSLRAPHLTRFTPGLTKSHPQGHSGILVGHLNPSARRVCRASTLSHCPHDCNYHYKAPQPLPKPQQSQQPLHVQWELLNLGAAISHTQHCGPHAHETCKEEKGSNACMHPQPQTQGQVPPGSEGSTLSPRVHFLKQLPASLASAMAEKNDGTGNAVMTVLGNSHVCTLSLRQGLLAGPKAV